MKTRDKLKVFVPFGIVVPLVFYFLIFQKDDQGVRADLDSFAQCLAQSGAVMYGADWCPHCQNEKKAFGDAWKFISYIECPDNPQKCLDLGIKGYPTWIWPDGKRFEGEQGITKLAKESGCELKDSEN